MHISKHINLSLHLSNNIVIRLAGFASLEQIIPFKPHRL